MKCLILTGGIGIIDPITGNRIPKCMMKVGNRPLIWHVMKLYSNYGIKDFIIALGLGGDIIKEFFLNSFELMHDIEINLINNEIKPLNKIPEQDWTIKLVDTGISASTGARISRCERFLKFEPFIITYSDILADVNIELLLESYKQSNKTLTITGVNPSSRFGTFLFKNEGGYEYETNTSLKMENSLINGGFMVANPSLFNEIEPINECNLERDVIKKLNEINQINLYSHDGFWQSIDSERDLNYINDLYLKNKRPWLEKK